MKDKLFLSLALVALQILTPLTAMGQSASGGVISGQYASGIVAPASYILNPSCATNTANTTKTTNATITRATGTNSVLGATSCTLAFTASSETVKFAVKKFDKGLAMATCEVSGFYNGTNAGSVQAYVEQDSGAGLAIVSNVLQLKAQASGAPFSFTFPCGGTAVTATNLVFRSSASVAGATVAGLTVSKATSVADTNTYEIGTVFYTQASTCPAGAITMDGSNISATYPELAAVIGSSTLADLRGVFVRGTGSQTIGGETFTAGTRGVSVADKTAVNGLSSSQAAHNHGLSYNPVGGGAGGGDARMPDVTAPDRTVYNAIQNAQPAITVSSSDTETAPAAVALTPCIQAKPATKAVRLDQMLDTMGMMFYWPTATCPAGSVKVDGTDISTTYPGLAARLGSSTLPNASGLFPRVTGSQTFGSETYTAPSLLAKANDKTAVNGLSSSQASHYHLSGARMEGQSFSYGQTNTGMGNTVIREGESSTSQPYAANTSSAQPAITVSSSDGETAPAAIAFTLCMSTVSVAAPLVEMGVVAPDYAGTTRINTVKTVTSNYTLTALDETVLVDTTSGAVTITVPASASFKGKKFFVTKVNTGANLVTVARSGSDTLGNYTTSTLLHSRGETIGLQADGGTAWNWFGTERMRTEKIEIGGTVSASCTTSNSSGNWTGTCSRTAAGTSVVAITSGIFSATPTCFADNVSAGSYNYQCRPEAVSATSVTTVCSNGASAVDVNAVATCVGFR